MTNEYVLKLSLYLNLYEYYHKSGSIAAIELVAPIRLLMLGRSEAPDTRMPTALREAERINGGGQCVGVGGTACEERRAHAAVAIPCKRSEVDARFGDPPSQGVTEEPRELRIPVRYSGRAWRAALVGAKRGRGIDHGGEAACERRERSVRLAPLPPKNRSRSRLVRSEIPEIDQLQSAFGEETPHPDRIAPRLVACGGVSSGRLACTDGEREDDVPLTGMRSSVHSSVHSSVCTWRRAAPIQSDDDGSEDVLFIEYGRDGRVGHVHTPRHRLTHSQVAPHAASVPEQIVHLEGGE